MSTQAFDCDGRLMRVGDITRHRAELAHRFFQGGADTLQIAEHFKCSESLALRMVNVGRALFLNRRSPYQRREAQA